MNDRTDWDRYYRSTPKYTSITRAISSRKIIGLIQRHSLRERPLTICEIGGANSCFVEAICSQMAVARYHVVDFNDYGLNLLSYKSVSTDLTVEKSDVLQPYDSEEKFDLVYSVGLIEHFSPNDTRLAIDGHFKRCKPGGTVLMTFPTPTVPYKLIRRVAEATGKWAFPDERPLEFGEVRTACSRRGSVVHQSINWWIGLTQGYIVTIPK